MSYVSSAWKYISSFWNGFDPAKLKTTVKLASIAINSQIAQKTSLVRSLETECLKCMVTGKEFDAKLQMEKIMIENGKILCMNVLREQVMILDSRIKMIEESEKVPFMLKESICTIIYAAARLTEILPFTELVEQLEMRYGSEFVAQQKENATMSVNLQVVDSLNQDLITGPAILDSLKALARRAGIDWQPVDYSIYAYRSRPTDTPSESSPTAPPSFKLPELNTSPQGVYPAFDSNSSGISSPPIYPNTIYPGGTAPTTPYTSDQSIYPSESFESGSISHSNQPSFSYSPHVPPVSSYPDISTVSHSLSPSYVRSGETVPPARSPSQDPLDFMMSLNQNASYPSFISSESVLSTYPAPTNQLPPAPQSLPTTQLPSSSQLPPTQLPSIYDSFTETSNLQTLSTTVKMEPENEDNDYEALLQRFNRLQSGFASNPSVNSSGDEANNKPSDFKPDFSDINASLSPGRSDQSLNDALNEPLSPYLDQYLEKENVYTLDQAFAKSSESQDFSKSNTDQVEKSFTTSSIEEFKRQDETNVRVIPDSKPESNPESKSEIVESPTRRDFAGSAIALYDYEASEPLDLSCQVGDIFDIIARSETGEGWLRCRARSTGEVGDLPENYLDVTWFQ